jgi:hypothetical protein
VLKRYLLILDSGLTESFESGSESSQVCDSCRASRLAHQARSTVCDCCIPPHITISGDANHITITSLVDSMISSLLVKCLFSIPLSIYLYIFTLHYRHQHHLALEPESQLPSGRPRRSLNTGVSPAKLYPIQNANISTNVESSNSATNSVSPRNVTLANYLLASRHRIPPAILNISPMHNCPPHFHTRTPTTLQASRLSACQEAIVV